MTKRARITLISCKMETFSLTSSSFEEPNLTLIHDRSPSKASELDEIESLQFQLQTLKELLKNAHAEKGEISNEEAKRLNERHQQRIEKLMAALQERDKKIAELQRDEYRFRQASSFLRDRLHEAQDQVKKLREDQQEANKTHKLLESLHQESENKSRQTHELLQKEAQAKQAALDEVTALYSQFDILKHKVIEFQQKQKENELALQEAIARKQQVEEVLQNREEHVVVLQHSIAEAEVRIQECLSEQQDLQDGLEKSRQDYEDAEARLKVAHHHLAKKVRETTELNDRVQLLERDLHEQQLLNDAVHERMRDLEALFESRCQQEHSLQEKLDIAAKDLEEISSHWEHKYASLNDRYLLTEAKLKDFKKLEEKYQRMQSLLSHINGIFDAETPLKDFVEETRDHHGQRNHEEEQQETKRPFQNLFDMHRTKSHFFE